MKILRLITFILIGSISIPLEVFSEGEMDGAVSSALAENSSQSAIAESKVRTEDTALSTTDMESAFYESMGENGSLAPTVSTTVGENTPSFQNIEQKTVQFKMNDSLWQQRETLSERDTSQFMMNTLKVFDAPTLQSKINESFREYLQKENILVKNGASREELSKWQFSKEDYIDDFKAASEKFDAEKFVNKKEAIAEHFLDQRIEKLARSEERSDRERAKGQEKQEENSAKVSDNSKVQDKEQQKDTDTGKDKNTGKDK